MEEFVDQESMADDFFTTENWVSQETGEPVAAIEPETENAEPAKTQTEPAPNKELEPADAIEQTETTENQDSFSFLEPTEDGSVKFNAESALEFIQRQADGKSKDNAFKAEPPQVLPTPAVDPAVAGQPEEVSYEQAARTNLYSALDYLKAYVAKGYSYEDAAQLAEQSVERDLNTHLQNKSLEDYKTQLRDELMGVKKEKEREVEMAELRPLATKNLYEIAKEGGYGSVEKLQAALMTPEYGGNFINFLFARDNPKSSFKSVNERAQAMNDWFVKFSSDKQSVKFLESVARAQINNKLFPDIVKHARATAENVKKTNTAGKSMSALSAQTKTRTNNSAPRQADTLEQWMSGPIDEV